MVRMMHEVRLVPPLLLHRVFLPNSPRAFWVEIGLRNQMRDATMTATCTPAPMHVSCELSTAYNG